MAALLKALQTYRLPSTIQGFGGVAFDQSGAAVSAILPSVGRGPWASYAAYFLDKLKFALEKADENTHIGGWKTNSVRDRIDKFIASRFESIFAGLEISDAKAIIHDDFSTYFSFGYSLTTL